MAFEPFDDSANTSPELLSARTALIRALLKHQHPRDTWDGINNLVAAISSRIGRDQFGNAETAEQRTPKANLAPLIEALKKRRLQDVHTLPPTPSNPSFDPDQRPVPGHFKKPVR